MAATGYGTVVYNGKRIIPGPYVTATKGYNRTEDGKKTSAKITFTLNGTLVACRGSAGTYTGGDYPADDTGCCKFEDILVKQDQLRELFDTDYQYFELRSYETDPPFAAHRWRVRVESIEFEEGPWVDKCDYTVVLTHQLEEDGPVDFTETWTLETNDDDIPCTYRLTHDVSAKFDEWWNSVGGDTDPGFERAMDWLKNHVSGYDGTTGINNSRVYAPSVYGFQVPVSFDSYNYTRSETIDETGGSYSLSESWILSEDAARQIESITVTKTSEENRVTASVEGTITPLRPAKDWRLVNQPPPKPCITQTDCQAKPWSEPKQPSTSWVMWTRTATRYHWATASNPRPPHSTTPIAVSVTRMSSAMRRTLKKRSRSRSRTTGRTVRNRQLACRAPCKATTVLVQPRGKTSLINGLQIMAVGQMSMI